MEGHGKEVFGRGEGGELSLALCRNLGNRDLRRLEPYAFGSPVILPQSYELVVGVQGDEIPFMVPHFD